MTMLRCPFGLRNERILGHGSGKCGGGETTPAVFGAERLRFEGAGPSTRALGNKDHAGKEAMLLRKLL
jgi:hypothetical protein